MEKSLSGLQSSFKDLEGEFERKGWFDIETRFIAWRGEKLDDDWVGARIYLARSTEFWRRF